MDVPTHIKVDNPGNGEKKTDFYVTPDGDVIPATGYRYMAKDANYLQTIKEEMQIPANTKGTYFSFDKFDKPKPGKLQVPHDASVRGSFNTFQIIDDVHIPHGKWGGGKLVRTFD